MQNYFNYFTEVEERFQQRRGSLLMLSTLDWALIETWREANIPLEAVLRGIDNAFDKHNAKALRTTSRTRKVNGLAWCAQSVMEAVEQAMALYLEGNAAAIESVKLNSLADSTAAEVAVRLRALALGLRAEPNHSLEELDRTLSVLEEKMFAALMTSTPEQELVTLREQATRELAPYRGKMQAVQIKQVQQQFLQKRLLEGCKLPRLSLFYMSHG